MLNGCSKPADTDDLTGFLSELDPLRAGDGAGTRVEPDRSRWRVSGVVVRLARPSPRSIGSTKPRFVRGASERQPRILDRARCRNRGTGVSSRDPGYRRRLRTMNGGAYGREVSDILVSARLVLRSGEVVEWPLDHLGYTIPHSEVPQGAVVVEALFRGTPGDPEAIGAEMDAIARAREESQPLRSRTGGSRFKNPPGHKAWA